MVNYLIIDLSLPDDVFLKNIRVDPIITDDKAIQQNSYRLTAEQTNGVLGIMTINDSAEGFWFAGDEYLSNNELKVIYEQIIDTFNDSFDGAGDPPFTLGSFNNLNIAPFKIITNKRLAQLMKKNGH